MAASGIRKPDTLIDIGMSKYVQVNVHIIACAKDN